MDEKKEAEARILGSLEDALASNDVHKALGCLRDLALMGRHQTFASVAELYERGNERIPVRVDLAFDWYRKSAYEQMDPEGYFGLARLYLSGRGVERDVPKARALFAEAFDLGSIEAAIILGEMYLKDGGESKDLDLAEKYLSSAAGSGYPIAFHFLASISFKRWQLVQAFQLWWRCISLTRRLTMADPEDPRLYRLHGAWKV